VHCSASQYSPYLSRPYQHPLRENGNAPSGTTYSVNTNSPSNGPTEFAGVSPEGLHKPLAGTTAKEKTTPTVCYRRHLLTRIARPFVLMMSALCKSTRGTDR
jgi:hypothetical protein